MSLIIRHHADEYEIVKVGAEPSSSCNEIRRFSHGAARQFISHTNVDTYSWRGVLMQLGVSISANFHDNNEILDGVAALCERDSI